MVDRWRGSPGGLNNFSIEAIFSPSHHSSIISLIINLKQKFKLNPLISETRDNVGDVSICSQNTK